MYNPLMKGFLQKNNKRPKKKKVNIRIPHLLILFLKDELKRRNTTGNQTQSSFPIQNFPLYLAFLNVSLLTFIENENSLFNCLDELSGHIDGVTILLSKIKTSFRIHFHLQKIKVSVNVFIHLVYT